MDLGGLLWFVVGILRGGWILKSPSGKNSCNTPFLIRPFPGLKTQKLASSLGGSDLHGNVRSLLVLP